MCDPTFCCCICFFLLFKGGVRNCVSWRKKVKNLNNFRVIIYGV